MCPSVHHGGGIYKLDEWTGFRIGFRMKNGSMTIRLDRNRVFDLEGLFQREVRRPSKTGHERWFFFPGFFSFSDSGFMNFGPDR